MIKGTHSECESSLVIHALLSEVLEDLLEGRLAHAILSDAVFFFLTFDLTEQVANRLVFLRYSDLVEVTALLKELDLRELLGQELDEPEAILLRVEELDQTLQAHLSLRVKVLFHGQICSEALLPDLVYDKAQ